jgi:uncharacterized Tic20 family protein
MSDAPSSLAPWGSETTADERTTALLAHLSAFVIPVLGPLLIWFLKKDSSRFTAYHALQSLFFQIACSLISGATCGLGLLLLVMPIWMAKRAHDGEWAGYPLIEGLGKS